MALSLKDIVDSYDPNLPLAEASTPPAAWYADSRIFDLEQRTVFAHSWQMVGRSEQVRNAGQYISCEVAGEPVLVVRGNDGALRAFYNVCRHHAAAVVTQPDGWAQHLRCPYHGWTYDLAGELVGTPDFAGVRDFDRDENGLVQIDAAIWENWIFVRLERRGPALEAFWGDELIGRIRQLDLSKLHWFERRSYTVQCNWKVFVDNYLDGGYHVPHLHRDLHSVLDYSDYTIENGERFCLQSCPIEKQGARSMEQGINRRLPSQKMPDSLNTQIPAVRGGEQALYYWLYPNFMIDWYEGVMDTNLVLPRTVDQTEVIFDFYFADISEAARERNLASIAVSERIQAEDDGICNAVQRGLKSRAYTAGRLSVRREAGEHLFHRLLYADFVSGTGE
jgi:choline monooxygenase